MPSIPQDQPGARMTNAPFPPHRYDVCHTFTLTVPSRIGSGEAKPAGPNRGPGKIIVKIKKQKPQTNSPGRSFSLYRYTTA